MDDHTVLCQIANRAFDVVGSLLHRDQLLAQNLRSPETLSRQLFREEHITLEMAATLKEQFRDHIKIVLFTPPEEKKNGADWYWYFQKGNHAIHAMVQAKRVRRTSFGQPDEDGTFEIDTKQLQTLTDMAVASSIEGLQTWLATFARFNATPPCTKHPDKCTYHNCQGNCREINRPPAIWIAQAKVFANNHQRSLNVRVQNVVEESVRLDCVLVCTDSEGKAGPAAKGFRLVSNLPSFEDCVEIIQSAPNLTSAFQGALLIDA